eukprot:TRINITY_DN20757_c0_g1_i1.p1 TRINITY_DN20757_c0_g1~~TRINITY_DN20757_c0_g1_i1.p1  ORF type:complete len:219 (-),score=42.74 TRINITY_DN20757_c0_g1_i1:1016-1672(-)
MFDQYMDLPMTVYGYKAQCGGCNGSIRQEWQASRMSDPAFLNFPEHAGSYKANAFLFGTMGNAGVAKEIRSVAECTLIPDADIIAIAVYVALVRRGALPVSLRTACNFYPGRVDAGGRAPGDPLDLTKMADYRYDDTRHTPSSPGLNPKQIIRKFKGYNVTGMNAFGFTADLHAKDSILKDYTPYERQLSELITTLTGAHTVGVNRAHMPNKMTRPYH